MNEDNLVEDEYCPDCGKYGPHTIISPCKGKGVQLKEDQLEEWYDEGQEDTSKVSDNIHSNPKGETDASKIIRAVLQGN